MQYKARNAQTLSRFGKRSHRRDNRTSENAKIPLARCKVPRIRAIPKTGHKIIRTNDKKFAVSLKQRIKQDHLQENPIPNSLEPNILSAGSTAIFLVNPKSSVPYTRETVESDLKIFRRRSKRLFRNSGDCKRTTKQRAVIAGQEYVNISAGPVCSLSSGIAKRRGGVSLLHLPVQILQPPRIHKAGASGTKSAASDMLTATSHQRCSPPVTSFSLLARKPIYHPNFARIIRCKRQPGRGGR